MFHGIVVFESTKGYVFAECDESHERVFVHQRNVERKRFLHLNDQISFDLAPNPARPSEMQAVNVKWIGTRTLIARQSSDAATGESR